MARQECDVTTFSWLDYESIGSPTSHITSLELFRENVVRPSLCELDAEINRLEHSNEVDDYFLVDDFAELFHRSVEGFLIAVQCMWERGLRNMLKTRDRKICKGANIAAVERATWGGKSQTLQNHFLRLMGVSMESFDSYSDLNLLQLLGSAIRHGDGQAARNAYGICPQLWSNVLEPGAVINAGKFDCVIPDDRPVPSFDSITLPERLLEQMMLSLQWFWEDIELMRCNSFRRKHHTVITRLERWPAERNGRAERRCWSCDR